jgi:ParB-like chromosome segregation protein Spo0J
MKAMIKRLAVQNLQPSETHAKAYSQRRVDMLAQSMLQHGQLEPLVINKKNTILSGVLRWEAAK